MFGNMAGSGAAVVPDDDEGVNVVAGAVVVELLVLMLRAVVRGGEDAETERCVRLAWRDEVRS